MASAVLSHEIWKRQDGAQPFYVSARHLDAAKKAELPDPSEQLDRFILYLGTTLKAKGSSGEKLPLNCDHLIAKIGALHPRDTAFIAKSAASEGLIVPEWSSPDDEKHGRPPSYGGLSLKGWEQFHKIQRGAVTSRTAFMAMPFNNPEVTSVFEDVFRPAVAETGYELKSVNVKQPAGLIDDHIRVGIRLSRFLIADLTGNNPGAYWEAGYAEGLGKPVIYTCKKQAFKKSHFDTNHHNTVIWEANKPDTAAEKLKDTIRATLPFEAKMEDDSL